MQFVLQFNILLERAERLGAIIQMLFKDQHALLKDLHWSDLWHAKVTDW